MSKAGRWVRQHAGRGIRLDDNWCQAFVFSNGNGIWAWGAWGPNGKHEAGMAFSQPDAKLRADNAIYKFQDATQRKGGAE